MPGQLFPGAVAPPAFDERPADQVVALEVAGDRRRPLERQDRTLDVAAALDFSDLRPEIIDRGGIAAPETSSGLRRRPRARASPSRSSRRSSRSPRATPKPPSSFWEAETSQLAAPSAPVAPFEWAGSSAGVRSGSCRQSSRAALYGGRAPRALEPLAEADEHPKHGRSGDEREDDVAERVRDVEGIRARRDRQVAMQ